MITTDRKRKIMRIRKFLILIAKQIWAILSGPYLRKGIWQMIISMAVGLAVIILSLFKKFSSGTSLLGFGTYFTFLIGIAAVIILVNSITVAFLVYYFQSVKAGQSYYYDKFRTYTEALRGYLNDLHGKGIISSKYDAPYRDIELLTMEYMPLPFKEMFIPFLQEIFGELQGNLKTEAEYEKVAGDLEVKAALLAEAVNGLAVNLVQRVVMKAWVSPVVKSFKTLALTMLIAIIGAIHFTGVFANILVGFAIGIGCMTILLILEIGWIAVKESMEFFDDERDIDHSETNPTTQTLERESPPAETEVSAQTGDRK